MSDIYQRQKTQFAGAFASDVAGLTFAGATTGLGIVQNVQISFAQQVARIYDVSNGGLGGGEAQGIVPVFYVGGRTQGQGTIARILGPQSGALCDFYNAMGNVCAPQDLQFTFAGGCGVNEGGKQNSVTREITTNSSAQGNGTFNKVRYSITGALMTNIGVTIGSQDMLVNENITLMFANLECDLGEATTAAVTTP